MVNLQVQQTVLARLTSTQFNTHLSTDISLVLIADGVQGFHV